MPKIVELSEFGKWCEAEGLSRADIRTLTGFSETYVSELFTGAKELQSFWRTFFNLWWGELFSGSIKKEMLAPPSEEGLP